MMPLSSSGLAPRFTGNPYELLTFLQIVHQLGQDNGLPDRDLIKYALRYTVPEEREVWEFCDTCTGVGNNSAVGGYSVRSNAIPAASLARQERSTLKGSATDISLKVSIEGHGKKK